MKPRVKTSSGSGSTIFRTALPREMLFLQLLLFVGYTIGQNDTVFVLPCLDLITNELMEGWAIENSDCVPANTSVFFYSIQPAPITANGLQAGAPTDLHVWFGSLGNPIGDAFDPQNFGLAIPGGGRLILDLSPHFLYDEDQGRVPVPNVLVELGLGMGNALLGAPCDDGPFADIVCAGWSATFGENNNTNQIIFLPKENETGLIGDRAVQVGAKFAHVHPQLGTSSGLYHNANGTCENTFPDQYCRFHSDCANATIFTSCIPSFNLTASIMATVLDGQGNILHKATQKVTFRDEPRYSVHATNAYLFVYQELVEVVDFQRVAPGAVCTNIDKPNGAPFSSNTPYAPRFVVFGPASSDEAFPHPIVPNLTVSLDTNTTAQLFSGNLTIGMIELLQPFGGDAQLLTDNAGFVSNGPGPIGGTVFAVPVLAGTLPETYAVRATVVDGAMALSRFVVDTNLTVSAAPSNLPSFSPTLEPSDSPTKQPTHFPTSIPTSGPSLEPTSIPSDIPTLTPSGGSGPQIFAASIVIVVAFLSTYFA